MDYSWTTPVSEWPKCRPVCWPPAYSWQESDIKEQIKFDCTDGNELDSVCTKVNQKTDEDFRKNIKKLRFVQRDINYNEKHIILLHVNQPKMVDSDSTGK